MPRLQSRLCVVFAPLSHQHSHNELVTTDKRPDLQVLPVKCSHIETRDKSPAMGGATKAIGLTAGMVWTNPCVAENNAVDAKLVTFCCK